MVFVFIVGLGVREDVRAGGFALVIFSVFLWLVVCTNEAKCSIFSIYNYIYIFVHVHIIQSSSSLSLFLSIYLSISL
jgi:hypothetical protein